jgi:hypothetical protein
LPIWILFSQFVEGRQLVALGALGGIFILLSQPFRILRIVQVVAPLNFSAEAYGGAVLQVGAMLLYLLMLSVILKWNVKYRDLTDSGKQVQAKQALPTRQIIYDIRSRENLSALSNATSGHQCELA